MAEVVRLEEEYGLTHPVGIMGALREIDPDI